MNTLKVRNDRDSSGHGKQYKNLRNHEPYGLSSHASVMLPTVINSPDNQCRIHNKQMKSSQRGRNVRL